MPFGYAREITIDHTKAGSADSASFPMLFGGTYSWLATVAHGGRVQSASGFDIIFAADQQGSVPLPFERVRWDATTGACEFWVQIPNLSHTADTPLFICYADPSITTDQQTPTAVWDANFVAVYHMGDSSTLATSDSTGVNNGTNHGATAAGSLLGSPGGSGHFTSSSTEYVDCGNNASVEITGAITVEAWVKADFLPGPGVFPRVVSTAQSNGGWEMLLHDSTGGNPHILFGNVIASGGALHDVPPGASGAGISAGPVYYFAWNYDGSSGALDYLNGALDNSATWGAGVIGASTTPMKIGFGGAGSPSYWDGNLDEIRISKTARSASWVLSTFNSGGSPSTFYSVGPESLLGLGIVRCQGFGSGQVAPEGSRTAAIYGYPILVVFLRSGQQLGCATNQDPIPAPVPNNWAL